MQCISSLSEQVVQAWPQDSGCTGPGHKTQVVQALATRLRLYRWPQDSGCTGPGHKTQVVQAWPQDSGCTGPGHKTQVVQALATRLRLYRPWPQDSGCTGPGHTTQVVQALATRLRLYRPGHKTQVVQALATRLRPSVMLCIEELGQKKPLKPQLVARRFSVVTVLSGDCDMTALGQSIYSQCPSPWQERKVIFS